MTSETLKVIYSPSLPLKSFPAYLEYKTVFPGVTDNGFLLPSSSKSPGPTAITCNITSITKTLLTFTIVNPKQSIVKLDLNIIQLISDMLEYLFRQKKTNRIL